MPNNFIVSPDSAEKQKAAAKRGEEARRKKQAKNDPAKGPVFFGKGRIDQKVKYALKTRVFTIETIGHDTELAKGEGRMEDLAVLNQPKGSDSPFVAALSKMFRPGNEAPVRTASAEGEGTTVNDADATMVGEMPVTEDMKNGPVESVASPTEIPESAETVSATPAITENAVVTVDDPNTPASAAETTEASDISPTTSASEPIAVGSATEAAAELELSGAAVSTAEIEPELPATDTADSAEPAAGNEPASAPPVPDAETITAVTPAAESIPTAADADPEQSETNDRSLPDNAADFQALAESLNVTEADAEAAVLDDRYEATEAALVFPGGESVPTAPAIGGRSIVSDEELSRIISGNRPAAERSPAVKDPSAETSTAAIDAFIGTAETTGRETEAGIDPLDQLLIAETVRDIAEKRPVWTEDGVEMPAEVSGQLKKEWALIKDLPPEKEKRFLEKLSDIGYITDQMKNGLFGSLYKGFGKLAGGKRSDLSSPEGARALAGTFFHELGKGYDRDGERARDLRKRDRKGFLTKYGGLGRGTGNLMRIGRVAYDIADQFSFKSVNPFRHATATAMFFGRGAEAAKLTRFQTQSVREKNWLEHDTAFDEAKRIYDTAAEKEGAVTAKGLETAYREQLPADIKRRLAGADLAGVGFLRKTLEKDADRLLGSFEKSLLGIDNDKKLTAGEKVKRRQELFLRKGELLNDLDSIVDRQGRADLMALSLRGVEKVSKLTANLLAIDSLRQMAYAGANYWKFFERYLEGQLTPPPEANIPPRTEMDELERREKHLNLPDRENERQLDELERREKHLNYNIDTPTAATAPAVDPEVLRSATVRAGDGPERIIIRQLQADPARFGFTGDPADSAAVKAWAGAEAHRVAIASGLETRLKGKAIGKLAIVLERDENGANRASALAIDAEGKTVGVHPDLLPSYAETAVVKPVSGIEVTVKEVPATGGQAEGKISTPKDLLYNEVNRKIAQYYLDVSPRTVSAEGLAMAGVNLESKNIGGFLEFISRHQELAGRLVDAKVMLEIVDSPSGQHLRLDDIYRNFEAVRPLEGDPGLQRTVIDLLVKPDDNAAKGALDKIFKITDHSRLERFSCHNLRSGEAGFRLHYDLKRAQDFDVIVRANGKITVDGPFGWDKEYPSLSDLPKALAYPLEALERLEKGIGA